MCQRCVHTRTFRLPGTSARGSFSALRRSAERSTRARPQRSHPSAPPVVLEIECGSPTLPKTLTQPRFHRIHRSLLHPLIGTRSFSPAEPPKNAQRTLPRLQTRGAARPRPRVVSTDVLDTEPTPRSPCYWRTSLLVGGSFIAAHSPLGWLEPGVTRVRILPRVSMHHSLKEIATHQPCPAFIDPTTSRGEIMAQATPQKRTPNIVLAQHERFHHIRETLAKRGSLAGLPVGYR